MSAYRFGRGLHVLLVDDHDLVREGLAALLRDYPDLALLDEALNGQEAFEKLKEDNAYELVITDLQMPVMDGLELIKQIRASHIKVCIIALTVSAGAATVADVMAAGGQGYMLKNTSKQLLFKAITEVMLNNTYIDPEISHDVREYMRNPAIKEECPLSPREIDILKCIAAELSNNQIANKLFISERTVETHRKNLFRKTNAKSVVGLMKFGMEWKLL